MLTSSLVFQSASVTGFDIIKYQPIAKPYHCAIPSYHYLMKIKCIIFWAFTVSSFITTGFSQTQVSIKSAFDSSELSFASIFNLTKKIYSSANQGGIFKIPAKEKCSFRISYIGYDDLNFIPKSNKLFDTIYLIRKSSSLPQVLVQSCKFTHEVKITNFTKTKREEPSGGVMCTRGESNGKAAVHIVANKTPAKLMSLSFWLYKFNFMPEYAVNSPFLISFFSYSEKTKLPDELIYEKPVFYFPNEVGKQTLTIDSLNIYIPKEGIYVCFEYIMDERYQWEEKIKDSIILHQGILMAGSNSEGYDSEGHELAFFDYKLNSWAQPKTPKITLPAIKINGTIKIETVYHYCKD
ncbi:MAG: hypothetical protein JWO92_2178 [Chitinophagaceae bacterium]|nr:hypothetical protein [Chitinophagaceae bacterium]